MTKFDGKDVHTRVTEPGISELAQSTRTWKKPWRAGNAANRITRPVRDSATPSGSPLRVVILMPVRDDWASATELIRRLDQAISSYPCMLDLLVVDDGSVQDFDPAGFQSQFSVVRSIRILHLSRNLGHQRAIALGLVHVHQAMPCDAVLVMDGDGEDTADGALQLIRTFSGTTAVFAERSRRTEPFAFRMFYQLYKVLYRMLTGMSVRVGNFSILPSRYLGKLVVMSELWNHYAATVFRSGLPFTTTPIPRGYRITGQSKMNYVSLAAHGMSAISLFGDVVGVRLLATSVAGSVILALGILAVNAIRIFTGRPIPGWAIFSMGTLAIILVQLITVAASFTFTILSNRSNLSFVPLRDYEFFVAEAEDVYNAPVSIPAEDLDAYPPERARRAGAGID
jgi:polyisoprenyl-phosphate glycosyltransferase